jgi:hypothetical protein
LFCSFLVGESGESENKSYSGHRYPYYNNKKPPYCHCQDPFFPKSDLNDVVEDEIYFGTGSFNPKAHRCMCKSDQFYHPAADIRRNYMRSKSASATPHLLSARASSSCFAGQQLGLNSLYSQPSQYSLHHGFCPCYNFTKYGSSFGEPHFKPEASEQFSGSFKVNDNDGPQRNTCECKSSFNAQQHDTEAATKMQHERDSLRNDSTCAFESAAAFKLELLNEKMKRDPFSDNFVVEKECLEKGENFLS